MIRKATLADIDKIIEVTKACAKDMIDKNIYQWNEFYPSRTRFQKDVERNECYVLDVKNQVLGCIIISTLMDEEYVPISWLTDNNQNIYIHRLAIHPNIQRQGYAQQLMDFAEHHAKENSYKSIRLDTFSQNKRNQKFYELRGYKKLGDIYFPQKSEHPFHCYELVF